MRHIPLRQQIVLSLFLTCLIQALTACGGGGFIKSFRVALASSGPLVNALATSGAIPQNRVTAIIADFDAGAACGLALQQDFSVIPKDDADHTAEKLAASTKAFKCFRVVVERQNFATHPRLQQVANIADGILASLVVFYSDSGADRAMAAPNATITAKNEKDLERQMESQMKALEEAMKP